MNGDSDRYEKLHTSGLCTHCVHFLKIINNQECVITTRENQSAIDCDSDM